MTPRSHRSALRVAFAAVLALVAGCPAEFDYGTDTEADGGEGIPGGDDGADGEGDADGDGDDGEAEADSGPGADDDGADDDGVADETGGPIDPPPGAPGGYTVVGNQILDADGNPHVFHGVSRPSLEWNYNGESLAPTDYALMASWGIDVVRIPLNQGFWLPGSVVHAPTYPATIDQQIAWAHDAGLDVILDLHWSDRGDFGTTPDQQRMADAHSIELWASVASRYADDGRVLFELYNEPHDVDWNVWRDGGPSGDGFDAVGMQTLYDTVRATGAENLVIVGGLDWAFDLSGVAGFRLDGYNIVYATHPYDFPNKAPATWDGAWGYLTESDAVIVTEFGSFDCSTQYSAQLIDYAGARDVSWIGWAWYPGGCDFPGLIEDWGGTPSPVGQIVRDALAGG